MLIRIKWVLFCILSLYLGIHQHPVWAQRGSQNEQSRETGNTCHTRQRKARQKHNTICVGHHNTQTNTNNVNKTCALLKTTGGKDEPNSSAREG
jgi:hypothetical protein